MIALLRPGRAEGTVLFSSGQLADRGIQDVRVALGTTLSPTL